MSEDNLLKFSNESKIRAQMQRREWTDVELLEALMTIPLHANGKKGAALRYVHPRTGKSVVIDAASHEIFHVGGEGFRYE